MEATLLVLGVPSDQEGWLARLLEEEPNLDAVRAEDEEHLLARLRQAEEPPALAVLGPELAAPVRMAQRIKQAAPTVGLLLLAAPGEVGGLRQVVMVSPFLGGEIACLDVEDTQRVLDEARRLVVAAERRRRNSAMVAFAQASLGQGETQRPAGSGLVLDQLLEAAPIGVALLDANGAVVGWNRRATDLTGEPERRVLGKPAYEALGAEPGSWLSGVADAVREDEVSRRRRLTANRPGSGTRHLEVTIAPLDASSQGARALMMFQDITDKVRAEEQVEATMQQLETLVEERTAELEHQRRFLRHVIDADPNLVFAKDREGRFTLANQAVAEMYGTTPEELVGKTDAAFNPDTEEVDAFREDDRKVLETGEPVFIEAEPVTNATTGETRWFQTLKVPLPDPDGSLNQVLGVATDITERRKAEERLRRHAESLEQTNRDLRQVAFVSSHDLREPLRTVSSFVQLLDRRYAEELDAEGREYIAYAVEGVERMDALLSDLLTYTLIGQKASTRKPVDLGSVLDRTLDRLSHQIETTSARVTHDPLPTVVGDPEHLGMVFENLLSNALKFQGPEPPEIHVGAEAEDERWHLWVEDNGIGFEQAYADKIFSIFQRLNHRDQYDGTGVGLAICRRAVEVHGGRIWAESVPGEGTTIHVELPVRGTGP